MAGGAQLSDGGPRWGRRPVLAGLLGATAIAFSAILVKLADESPSTAAVFRCAYAVPLLAVLAVRESRLYGPRPARDHWIGVAAGVLFSADLITWHHSIANVGAGLATVLGNLQVVLVAFAAWAVLGERPERRIVVAVPVVFTGAVMISGVLESGGYGRDPVLGTLFGLTTTLAYAAFILVLRQVNRDLRRPAGPLLDATASAAVVSAVAGRDHRRRRPRAELAVARLAGAAGADLAGDRVAADLRLAAAAPGRADLRAAARAADRRGRARGDHPRRGAVGAPARRAPR